MKSSISILIAALSMNTALAGELTQFNKTDNFYYADEYIHVKYTNDLVGQFNHTIRFMADQLVVNKDIDNVSDSRVAIVNIVNADNFEETGKVGQAIEEHMMHEMQARGFKVVDFKMMPNFEVRKDMDSVLSRDVAKLKSEHNIHYVLTGTYRNMADGIIFNLRMINMKDNVIVSTAQSKIAYKAFEYLNSGYDTFKKTHNGTTQVTPVEEAYTLKLK